MPTRHRPPEADSGEVGGDGSQNVSGGNGPASSLLYAELGA